MNRTRVSIAGLMGVVLMAALGVAALRSPTPLWSGAIYTLALAGLGLSVPGVIYRRGARRAFWVGFAAFGWGYWLASLSPWVGDAMGPKLATTAMLDVARDWRMAEVPVAAKVDENAIMEEFLAMSEVVFLKAQLAQLGDLLRDAESDARRPASPYSAKRKVEAVKATLSIAEDRYQELWKTTYPVLKNKLATSASLAKPAIVWPREPFRRVGHSLFALLSALVGGMIAVRFHRTRDDASPCPDDDRSTSDRSTT